MRGLYGNRYSRGDRAGTDSTAASKTMPNRVGTLPVLEVKDLDGGVWFAVIDLE